MHRSLRAEILDRLPADHPDAIRSRRDLALINCLMGNGRWLARSVTQRRRGGENILELGAGDGRLARSLHARIGDETTTFAAVDFAPAPADWPDKWRWHRADLRTFDQFRGHAILLANLVLHHFPDHELRDLGARMRANRDVRVVLAAEPARGRVHRWQAHSLALLGVNHVTRHDAPASVDAGFRDRELPEALGLRAPEWRVDIRQTWLGSYRMCAVRDR